LSEKLNSVLTQHPALGEKGDDGDDLRLSRRNSISVRFDAMKMMKNS
jgi:hypothetical protein